MQTNQKNAANPKHPNHAAYPVSRNLRARALALALGLVGCGESQYTAFRVLETGVHGGFFPEIPGKGIIPDPLVPPRKVFEDLQAALYGLHISGVFHRRVDIHTHELRQGEGPPVFGGIADAIGVFVIA